VIHFARPEAFLLGAILLLALRRRIFVRNRAASVLRVLLAAALVAILAEPYIPHSTEGRDLILVVDRSRSMPDGSLARAKEVAALAQRARRKGDRIGFVTFGRDVAVESTQREEFRYTPPAKNIDPEGTSLARAIETAVALVPPGRPASIVLVTDGEQTGADPSGAARDALRRGVRIDAVPIRRDGSLDLAVDEVALPDGVGSGEPFLFSAWVRSERAVTAPVRLLRDGVVIAEGQRELRRGLNRIVFRDMTTGFRKTTAPARSCVSPARRACCALRRAAATTDSRGP